MIPTSETFKAAVQQSHIAVSRVDVIQNGKVVRHLDVFEGEVTADRTAAQMRTCSILLGDPDGTLTPADATSLLAPFGTRLQLFKGVRLPKMTVVTDWAHDADSWSNGGNNNGTIADPATGDLILGYGS